ncbi:hypothetical protein [Tenacibaculum sp. MAR_2009_124]|uniref:hypothetical protein n=1 Tax=Tenacibaculum sp. MAR_2009_124 TaxID=1250059 RepID=UPI000B890856|nr:hypothetical protein [Tenacibaculum sp. MAR_2009_124]
MFVLLTPENTYYTNPKSNEPFSKNISDAQVFESLEKAKKEQQIALKKHNKTTSINTFIH